MTRFIKAHWECWQDCNLHCAFCYRMKGEPLETADAIQMLSQIQSVGFRDIAFVGGDPSLRTDIGELITEAKRLGFNVEVQTNAHLFDRAFKNSFSDISLFGFSLDGPTPQIHDTIRGTKDNYRRVIDAIEDCEASQKSYVVRTVINRMNCEQASDIVEILNTKKYIKKWSLLEFSPIGEGFTNRERFAIDNELFKSVATRIKDECDIAVDVYENSKKGGTYCLIKPNGDVYGTTDGFEGVEFPSVGNVITDGIEACLENLNFSETNHIDRYDTMFS